MFKYQYLCCHKNLSGFQKTTDIENAPLVLLSESKVAAAKSSISSQKFITSSHLKNIATSCSTLKLSIKVCSVSLIIILSLFIYIISLSGICGFSPFAAVYQAICRYCLKAFAAVFPT